MVWQSEKQEVLRKSDVAPAAVDARMSILVKLLAGLKGSQFQTTICQVQIGYSNKYLLLGSQHTNKTATQTHQGEHTRHHEKSQKGPLAPHFGIQVALTAIAQ